MMAKKTFGQRKIANKNNFTNREALEKGGMDTLADRINMAANVAMSGNPMSAGNSVKKEKRKANDISYSMLKPFYPQNSELYTIEYIGLESDTVENYICHCFKVRAKEETPNLLNGEYYFDSESFQLVKVDFSPAKLTKKTMFKMKELKMTILYILSEGSHFLY